MRRRSRKYNVIHVNCQLTYRGIKRRRPRRRPSSKLMTSSEEEVEAYLPIAQWRHSSYLFPSMFLHWPLFFSPFRSESIASCRAGSVLSVASRRSRHEGTSAFNTFLHFERSNMTSVTFMSHTYTHFFTSKGQIWPEVTFMSRTFSYNILLCWSLYIKAIVPELNLNITEMVNLRVDLGKKEPLCLTHFFTFKGQIWPQWLLCGACGAAGSFGSKQSLDLVIYNYMMVVRHRLWPG